MKPNIFFARSVALAIAVSGALAGCNRPSEPPTQLEAELFASRSAIHDRDTLARDLIQRLNIKELKFENVRIAVDEDKKAYFFRLVGKDALAPELLKQVSAGLAQVNLDNFWQGKLIVEANAEVAEAAVAAIMKTDKREFPVNVPWQSARVEAYLMQSASEFTLAGSTIVMPHYDAPQHVACVLSFDPKDTLPELKGMLEEPVPENEDTLAKMRRRARLPSATTVPHRVVAAQPDLAKLKPAVVEDHKLMFEFALIKDVKVAAKDNGGQGIVPVTIDSSDIALCQNKLREVAPEVQNLIDRARLLADVSSIGPAQLVPMPKPR